MKRFTLIPVGENFEFQGERYCKTGPLTATSVDGKRQRMIPRSAMVRPLHESRPQDEPALDEAAAIDAARVHEAFTHYHNGCLEWLQLAERELATESAAQIREALETARRRFLQELGL